MASSVLDILIRVRDQLSGLDRARSGFDSLKKAGAAAGTQISQSLIGTFGAGFAVSYLQGKVREVISDIDNIEGIDQTTIDSVKDFAAAFEDLDGGLKRLIAGTIAFFDDAASGIALTVNSLRYGVDGAVELYVDARRAAEGARAAEEALRAARQASADALKEQVAAGLKAENAFDALNQSRESAGQRADRLQEEIVGLGLLLAATKDETQQAKLNTSIFERQMQLEKAKLTIEQERKALNQAEASRTSATLTLEEQKYAIAERIYELQKEIDANARQTYADAEALNAADKERLSLWTQLEVLQNAAADIRPPDPESFREQLQAVFEATTTYAEMAANGARVFFAGMTNQVTQDIDALLLGTQSLGDTLSGVWTGFLSSMRQAFSSMAGEWAAAQAKNLASYILTKGQMFAVDKAFNLKSMALSAASAAKSLLAWLPAATAALVASFGTAGAIALAAVAALGLAGGFEGGGYTGGVRGRPAGIVHGEEVVFSAPAVDALGRDNLLDLHSQALSPAPAQAAPAPAGGAGGRTTVGIYDRRSSAEDYLQSAPGQKILYDAVRGIMTEVG